MDGPKFSTVQPQGLLKGNRQYIILVETATLHKLDRKLIN